MSTGGMLFSTEVDERVGVAPTTFATTFFLATFFLATVGEPVRCVATVVGGTAVVGEGDDEIAVAPVGGDGAAHPPGDGDVEPLCSLPQ